MPILTLHLTHHAACAPSNADPTPRHGMSVRMQNSPPEAFLDYGTEHHDRRGAVAPHLDRAATRRLARAQRLRSADVDSLRDLYAVVTTDGRLLTVGHTSGTYSGTKACVKVDVR